MDIEPIAGVAVALPDIALTFPSIPEGAVDRGYLLDTIESIFASGNQIVLLDGEEEIGKTTLLAQFAIRHASTCFSLFVPPFSDISSDPAQLRYDITNQIHWSLYGTRLDISEEVTAEKLRNALHVLQRKARRDRTHYYFAIDGVDGAGAYKALIKAFVLSNLPLGSNDCRFIFASSGCIAEDIRIQSYISRIQTVSPFSLSETAVLLESLHLDAADLAELHRTFRGIPGRLVHAKRLALAGESVSNLLADGGTGPNRLFEKEWRLLNSEPPTTILAIAAIAFIAECQSLPWLERVVGQSVSAMQESFARLGFLTVNLQQQTVAFVSEGHQRFARKELQRLEKDVIERSSRLLVVAPDSEQALRLLPDMLIRGGQISKLADYLTPDRIVACLRATKSLATVLQLLRRTGTAASESHHTDLQVRVTTCRVVLQMYLQVGILLRQVDAALAIRDSSLALSLANAAELDEHRLRLLAVIAKDYKQRGLSPEPSLLDQISRLAGAADFGSMGELALDIAADLLVPAPDLAARALEGYAKNADEANALDQAIVSLSLKAMRAAQDEGGAGLAIAQVDKLAAGTSAQLFSRRLSVLFKTGDAEAVLLGARDFTSTSEKVFFLRQWLRANVNDESAPQVAVGISQLILGDAAYAPNATVFRDLALPLHKAPWSAECEKLITFLDGQGAYAKQRGPTTDYYRLRFSLGIARIRFNHDDAVTILAGDALELDSMIDAAMRGACFAWLARAVKECDLGTAIDDPYGLREYAHQGMTRAVGELLTQSADQFEGVKGILSALSTIDATAAIALAQRLNTLSRREEGLVHVGRRLCADAPKDVSILEQFSLGDKILEMLTDRQERQALMVEFAEWASSRAVDVLSSLGSMHRFRQYILQIGDPDVRVRLLARFVGRLPEALQSHPPVSDLIEDIRSNWQTIEEDYIRIDAGYAAVAELGKGNLGAAKALAVEVDHFAEPRWGNLRSDASARYLLLLQGRSAAALFAVQAGVTADIEELNATAARIGSDVERARLLSQAALFIARVDAGAGRQVIDRYVIPIVISLIHPGHVLTTEARSMLIHASAALWLSNQNTAERIIGTLDVAGQQQAYIAILGFVINRRIPFDAWSASASHGGPLDENLINESLALLDKIEDDAFFSRYTEMLLDRLKDRAVSAKLTSTRKAHLTATLRAMAARKLPSKTGVQHEGYLLLVEANLLAAEQGKHDSWLRILDSAAALPNLSDSCFVLTRTAALLPAKYGDLKRQCVDKAISAWKRLPTFEERVLRLETIVEKLREDYPTEVKALVGTCVNSWNQDEWSSAPSKFRALIEIAYKVDEEWAASLVSVTDDDPIRRTIREAGGRALEDKKLERELGSTDTIGTTKVDLQKLANASWTDMGIVNASGSTGLDWEGAIQLINIAAKGTLAEAYPLFAYALTCISVKYRGAAKISDRVRTLHNSILSGVSVMRCASDDLESAGATSAVDMLRSGDLANQTVVQPNERAKALAVLGRWLEKVDAKVLDVVDPYFAPTDISLLIIVRENAPHCRVRILTSLKAVRHTEAREVQEAFSRAWRELGMPADPPDTAIVVVGRTSDGALGIHDRWWLSETSGLSIGTSFNSLGITQTSVIDELTADQVSELRAEVDPYFQLLKRSLQGEKLEYVVVTLP